MAKRSPITDHYGTEITVDGPVYKSAGTFVCLEREETSAMGGSCSSDGLTPEQARELGEWLIEASEARG